MRVPWKRRNVRISGSLLVITLAACCASALNATEWHEEVVDPSGGGKFSSLRIDKDGNGHVAYVDDQQYLLKYSFWDHSLRKWFTTTVDKSSGFCALALDSKQHAHISYLNYGTGQLKYAHWNGSSWDKQTIRIQAKDITFYTSIALDSNDNPSITYYEYWGTGDNYSLHLRIVSWTGSYWSVRTVDSTPGSGKFNSVAVDSMGNPHVAYGNVKSENTSLRYAHWNGQSWVVEVLEGVGNSGYSAYSVSLVLDKENTPHITCTDHERGLVKYATRRNGKWQIEIVDVLSQAGYPDRNGIALDEQGDPYISYYDAGQGVLKLAHRKGQKWATAIVAQNFAGFTSSLQIAHDTIWITYADESAGGLKCARGTIDGTGSIDEERTVSAAKQR